MTISKLLVVALLLSLIPATAYAVVATHSSQAPLASSSKLTSLSIAVSGNATTIGNSSTPNVPPKQVSPMIITATSTESSQTFKTDASVSAKVVEQNNGTIAFNVTSVTLKIGSTTYTGNDGSGIFNQHSLVVVVHATVTSGTSSEMLILIGHASASAGTDASLTVTFSSPQSKLASDDFLSLEGTLTLS